MSDHGEQLLMWQADEPPPAPADPPPKVRVPPKRIQRGEYEQLDALATYADPRIATIAPDPEGTEGWREEMDAPRPATLGDCVRAGYTGYGPEGGHCPVAFCRHSLVTDIVDPSGDVEGAAKRYVVNLMNPESGQGRRRSWAVDAPESDLGWAELEAAVLDELDARDAAGYPTCGLAAVNRRIVNEAAALADPMPDAMVGKALGVGDDQVREEAVAAWREAEDEMDRRAAAARRRARGPIRGGVLVQIRRRTT